MKKYNVFKILGITLILTMVLSYFVPVTTISYGSVNKGTAMPVGFADTFLNSLTSLSAFTSTFIYLIVIAVFYKLIKKTGKYDALVNDVAFKFSKNKNLFIALTVLVLGIVTAVTGELLSMIIFVPFLIDTIDRLGYEKKVSIIATIGSIIVSFSGSMYTYYANQMLQTTVNDNLVYKILIILLSLVSVIAFVLVFNKSNSVNIEKSKESKITPLKVSMWILFVFIILGFTSWNSYFNFTGFDSFLETLRSGELFKVSVFDALIGQMAVAFGQFQLYHMAAFIAFMGLLMVIIYKVNIDNVLEAVASGIKSSMPYVVIALVSYIVLINSYGMFYTIAIDLTGKVNIADVSIVSIISSVLLPDYGYATQFAFTAISSATTTTDYTLITQIVFQAIYSLFLLVSPTSILILMGLRYTNENYKSWLKYIFKFFVVLFVIDLIILTIAVDGKFSLAAIILTILLLIFLIALVLRKKNEKVENVNQKVEVKEEKKVEKNSTTSKKESNTKRNTTKKTTKSNSSNKTKSKK